MFRYLVAWLPTFRLERCGWTADRPVALVAEEKSAWRVQCATPTATRGGVRPGMTAAEARAVLPTLQVETLDPQGEAQDLQELAHQLLRLSPQVGALPPDALVVDISGAGARRRGPGGAATAGVERALMERTRLRLRELGHAAVVVVADDPGTAWACAAWGRRCRRVAPGQGPQAMADLPLASLGLPQREHELLQGLGLHTVGAFAALPPASVVGRLSPLAVAAHALACGRGPQPALASWDEDQPLVFHQDLPDPVEERDALIFVLNALLRDAAACLSARDRAAVRVVLRLRLDPQDDAAGAGSEQEISLRLGSPTRDSRHMLDLLRTRLERVQLAGPVIGVELLLPEATPFTGRQRDLLERQRAAESLDEAVARLQDELGEQAVTVPMARSRHLPEGACLGTPWPGPGPAVQSCQADSLARKRSDGSDPVRAWVGFSPPLPPLRPALLLRPALGAEVQAQAPEPELGQRPARLHIDGRWLDLVDIAGPEHLAGEWWEDGFDRLYWCATLADGRRAWLYQEEGHWLLHGWFDAS